MSDALTLPLSASTLHLAPLVKRPYEFFMGEVTNTAHSLHTATIEAINQSLPLHGHSPSQDQQIGLNALRYTLTAIASQQAENAIYLSSLDPGVGKTTAVMNFAHELTMSRDFEEVGMLICLPRLNEIERVLKGSLLKEVDFAVLTSDPKLNSYTATPPSEAKILFTTHQMVKARCQWRDFAQVEEFKFSGLPRAVRVWDEAMMPNDVVEVSADAIARLFLPLRNEAQKLTEAIEEFHALLRTADPDTVLSFPIVQSPPRTTLDSLEVEAGKADQQTLQQLLWLSGRQVRVAKDHRDKRFIFAVRQAIPNDFLPALVLDASGRVKGTYQAWEQHHPDLPLIRLPSAAKDYSQLTITVAQRGSSQDSWGKHEDDLLGLVAARIDTKPEEEWLVLHHGKICKGAFAKRLRSRLAAPKTKISYLTWGQHQGTNSFRHIKNVVIASTLFLPDHTYHGLAYAACGLDACAELPEGVLRRVKLGESMDAILQGLCRSAVRYSAGAGCKPCDVFLITAKGSGIVQALPQTFPGCRVITCSVAAPKLTGKVKLAVDHLDQRLAQDPNALILFAELQAAAGVANAANFNRSVRRHDSFKEAVQERELIEVAHERRGHGIGLQRLQPAFGPCED